MLIILSALLIVLLVLFSIVLAHSQGTLEPFRDKNGEPLAGSISEKIFVEIGGVQQGMFIRGKNTANPVLLFVHGGPSFSEYFLVDRYPTGLEEEFTVCYWEERGGGLSYSPQVSQESMTMEQLESDAIEVTKYLHQRFGQEKIYLMAHSGGTAFAIKAAAHAPELYCAYIGIAQITNQAASEKIAYEYLTRSYKNSGNQKMLKKLAAYPILSDDSTIIPFFKSNVRDQAMHALGVGTMGDMKSLGMDVVVPIMLCKAYTLEEKINLWKSKFSFIRKTALIDELLALDLTDEVPALEVPVYFFSGQHDLTVNHHLSKSYLEQLQAPLKGFYTFENSAHSPNFEEPDKMMEIIGQDVLANGNSLADDY